jgi:hypothetical protein
VALKEHLERLLEIYWVYLLVVVETLREVAVLHYPLLLSMALKEHLE